MKAKNKKSVPQSLSFGLIALLIGLFCTSFILFTIQIVGPTEVEVKSSDAIVSLAPGQYRLPTALSLLDEGVSRELAVSWPTQMAASISAENLLELELCSEKLAQNLTCFVPQPVSTLGEALSVRKLALDKKWESVTVVTSSYHVFRTSYIFSHCLPGVKVQVVAAPTDLSPGEWLFRVAYENASLVKAFIQVPAACSWQ